MSDHDEDGMFTGVLHVKAFGLDNWRRLFLQAATEFAAGTVPARVGVTVDFDPGGGPYNRSRKRNYQFDESPMNAAFYPGNDNNPGD